MCADLPAPQILARSHLSSASREGVTAYQAVDSSSTIRVDPPVHPNHSATSSGPRRPHGRPSLGRAIKSAFMVQLVQLYGSLRRLWFSAHGSQRLRAGRCFEAPCSWVGDVLQLFHTPRHAALHAPEAGCRRVGFFDARRGGTPTCTRCGTPGCWCARKGSSKTWSPIS